MRRGGPPSRSSPPWRSGSPLAPGAAASYWTLGLLDADRVGPPWLAHNQSAYGVLTRLLDASPPALLWVGVTLPLVGAALLVAADVVAPW